MVVHVCACARARVEGGGVSRPAQEAGTQQARAHPLIPSQKMFYDLCVARKEALRPISRDSSIGLSFLAQRESPCSSSRINSVVRDDDERCGDGLRKGQLYDSDVELDGRHAAGLRWQPVLGQRRAGELLPSSPRAVPSPRTPARILHCSQGAHALSEPSAPARRASVCC